MSVKIENNESAMRLAKMHIGNTIPVGWTLLGMVYVDGRSGALIKYKNNPPKMFCAGVFSSVPPITNWQHAEA